MTTLATALADTAPGAQSSPTFGRLTPLLAPRSIAVVGASDRDGNLGGVAVGFLRKFGFQGSVWPVNSSRAHVRELPCYPRLTDLPHAPDLAVLAVPAEALQAAVQECVDIGVPAAIAWAGGFSEQGPQGAARQRDLAALCHEGNLALCGPNCIGIINTATGMTASFSSMLFDQEKLLPGSISIVSQSGGIAVMAHARAQQLGVGFRATVSAGNEAVLTVADFVHALAQDDGTRVIAVYTEGLSDPDGFAAALAEARRRDKPVVVLKGGASEASGRAALAHTGRLAGADRAFDAVLHEFAAIRVRSTEELLDVGLQLASMRRDQLPRGNRVLISSFGGGSGVVATDQCVGEGLTVSPLDEPTRAAVLPRLTPLSSAINPVDLTPGMMTNPRHRADLPEALRTLASASQVDAWMFMAAGFGALAPELVEMLETLHRDTDKPVCITWQAMPDGIHEALIAKGLNVFSEHARAARALGHLVRHAADLRHPTRHCPALLRRDFDWTRHLGTARGVLSEHVAAAILEDAGLPVAKGRLARDAEAAVAAANDVGYPVAVKGISAAVTHRAAAGLVALNLEGNDAVARTERAFRARAVELGVDLDGVWVQHMFGGDRELLVTALRDRDFGVMVGVGVGGAMTEVVDDVVLARAPLDAEGAAGLIRRLRTMQRFPDWLTGVQIDAAAAFVADFSALVAGLPAPSFTFEINPLKVGPHSVAAVDGLVVLD